MSDYPVMPDEEDYRDSYGRKIRWLETENSVLLQRLERVEGELKNLAEEVISARETVPLLGARAFSESYILALKIKATLDAKTKEVGDGHS